jgi:hypothetical protein
MRLRLVLIFVGAFLVIATYTFPLWGTGGAGDPTTASQDGFPGISADLQELFRILPPDQQAAYRAVSEADPVKGAAMVTAALSARVPVPEDDQEMPQMNTPVVVSVGRFARLDPVRWAQGEVTIYRQTDAPPVVRLENFSTARGPDLHVFLSRSTEPQTPEEMRLDEAEIDLGRLQGDFGAQNFVMPQGSDVTGYNSVVLYSPSLDMIYSYAPLFVRS